MKLGSLRYLALNVHAGEVDLAPFADLQITISLGRDMVVTGTDKLGPGVTLLDPGRRRPRS
ncbi:hypothetical protein OG943_05370 [Amycolatopsis sp. NBC_00345]|uniref:hypothetical protein n=1 Tax=Amycolatopsis sp. NBC_00345 TaxID=2975955 RepID=UPI002E261FA4